MAKIINDATDGSNVVIRTKSRSIVLNPGEELTMKRKGNYELELTWTPERHKGEEND